jgi:hypothetical protein
VRTRKNLGQRISEELRTDLALILLADVLHAALNQHSLRWIVPAALAICVSELQALASALTPLGSLPTCASRSEETKNSDGNLPQIIMCQRDPKLTFSRLMEW